METPEAPRDGNAARLGRSSEAYGLAAARWAGRGDEGRGVSLLALTAAAGADVCLFMPWVGQDGHTVSGWNFELPRAYGLLALGVVLVELLALTRAWFSGGAELVVFEYGAWLGLVFAIVLLLLGALLLARLWRPRP